MKFFFIKWTIAYIFLFYGACLRDVWEIYLYVNLQKYKYELSIKCLTCISKVCV